MIEKISEPKPLSGMMRIFARAPIGFYRVGLGWVFGGRFLMLIHNGRLTGKQRYVVSKWSEMMRKMTSFTSPPAGVRDPIGSSIFRRMPTCACNLNADLFLLLPSGFRWRMQNLRCWIMVGAILRL